MDWTKALQSWGAFYPVRLLLGGYRNQVMLVEGQSGLWVAKTTRRSEAALAWLEPVHQAAKTAGFAIPSLQRTLEGSFSANGCTIEPFLEGQPIHKDDLPKLEPFIQRFHVLTRGLPQRPSFASSVELLEINRGGDVDLEVMPKELVERCRSLWRHLENDPPAVIHGDLNLGNILQMPDGRFALLDWDEARVDNANFDLWQLGEVGELEQKILEAWEVAACWMVELEHAREVASKLLL